MKNNSIIFLNFWPKGGMRHYSDALINALISSFDILYISNYKNNQPVKNRIINLSVNPLYLKNYYYLVKILIYFFKIRPKVIHLNSGHPCLLPIYPFFIFFNSVVTVHDAVSHEGESLIKIFFHKIQLLFFSLFFKKIIVHSEKIKNELPKYVIRKKIFVTPFINLSHLSEGNMANRKENKNIFKVLFFGRILEYKGLKYLVEAFNYLDKDKYELTIAGEGNINFEVNNKNIKVFNRFIDDSEIPFFFNAADVIVAPYISASQSGVVFLSFAYGKPVISTNVGSIEDVVTNGINGIIINSKSSSEIAAAIIRISSINFYEKLAINIKKKLGNNVQLVEKALLEIYEN